MPSSITDLDQRQLEEMITGFGAPGYRAKQIMERVYKGMAWTYDEMGYLPKALRMKMADALPLHGLEEQILQTGRDGTVKGLFQLGDGSTVESALMPYPKRGSIGRNTVCVSTQVGCNIGCPFCATGMQGFERNLSSGEMVDQVLYFGRYLKNESSLSEDNGYANGITNIVFMGMGEPLANYEELWKAVVKLNAAETFGLGARNITISTAGLAPEIRRLGREKLQVGLAVSLHAGTDELRDKLVPLNRKYPLEELISACREYYYYSGRRVSFEYVLFSGINDTPEQAKSLSALLKGLNCHVNLIPANNTGSPEYRAPSWDGVDAFQEELKQQHVKTTVRQSRGKDIDAGCGQLRSRIQN